MHSNLHCISTNPHLQNYIDRRGTVLEDMQQKWLHLINLIALISPIHPVSSPPAIATAASLATLIFRFEGSPPGMDKVVVHVRTLDIIMVIRRFILDFALFLETYRPFICNFEASRPMFAELPRICNLLDVSTFESSLLPAIGSWQPRIGQVSPPECSAW
jgi:hypothetical protein